LNASTLRGFVVALVPAVGACQFHARSAEEYRRETRALIDARSTEIKNCYSDLLTVDPHAAGTVVARFTVVEKTGAVEQVEILPESTAPDRLKQCVNLSLYGLTLAPPDARQGRATFVWTFTPS
jgi:hypothetical protein